MEIVGFAVISLDGRLTRHDEDGVTFASAEDQAHFHAALAGCDASVMGRATFDTAREAILGSLSPGRCRTVMTRRPERYGELQREGVLEFTDLAPERLVEALARRGYERVALLGGAQVYGAFAAADLVDEWQVTVEPRLFGAGTPLLAARTDRRLVLADHRRLNASTLLLRYRRA